MTTEGVNRRLTAILSADVEGYSRLMSQDEVGTIRTLTAYREAMTALIQQYKGRVVDSPGDNLLAEFVSVMDAVNCAVEIQQDLAERNAETPSTRMMRFRIGVNLGDVVEEEGRIYGDGVNIAARIESLAEAGRVCVSGTVFDTVQNKMGLEFGYLGEQKVKNITQPVRVYRVLPLPRIDAQSAISANGEVLAQKDLPEKSPLPLPDKPSIAVLPFENMSGDPEQEYFVDGMTDDLITDLSKISGLFVIARNSVFTYKDQPVKIKQVGRDLGVRYVLEGSVRKAGNKVRINAQLIDATTDNHLWADRYDDDLTDVFALQDRITQKIVSALSIKLTANEQEQVARKDTDNLEAYDFFLRGKQLYYSLSLDKIDEALSMFNKAIELDPQFALAYAFHARTNWHKSLIEPESRDDSHTEASEYAQKALVLDDTLPEAHIVLSLLQHMDGLHDEAVASAEKAVALDYNNAESYLYQAYALTFAGRHDEAFESINKAFRLNPNPPALYYLGLARIQFNRRRYNEALHNLYQAPEDSAATIELKVPSFAYAGLLEEARNELKNILKIFPNYSLYSIRNGGKYKLREDVEHHLEGFRMAGLQRLSPNVMEWKSDADGISRDGVFTRENPPAISLKCPSELIIAGLEPNQIFRATGPDGLPAMSISINKITGEVKEFLRGFSEGLKITLQGFGSNVKIFYNASLPHDAYGESYPAQECEIEWKSGGTTLAKTYANAIVKEDYCIQLFWTDLSEAVDQNMATIKEIFKTINLDP